MKTVKAASPGRAPTKVLLLIKGLDVGGAEKLLALSTPYLDDEQFSYEIAYLVPKHNALVGELTAAGVPVHCLEQSSPFDARAIFRLANLLRERRVGILHLHLPYPAVLGRLAAKLAGVKSVVYTEHCPVHRGHLITRQVNGLTYRMNDVVIAVSGEVERSINTFYGVSAGNGPPTLVTIPNGVDHEALRLSPDEKARVREDVRREFGIAPDAQIVIYVANLRPEKGHRLLLNAASTVVRDAPGTTFLLVGRGETKDAVRTQVQSLGLSKQVVLAGFREDVGRLLHASDLFVLASDYEGLPVSLLEAMAAGVPAVCTRVGGIPEVVEHDVTGRLTPPSDAGALAADILMLLRDDAMRARMGVASAERVAERFSIRTMVHRTEEIYRHLLASKVARA